jgi:hypothetical protein
MNNPALSRIVEVAEQRESRMAGAGARIYSSPPQLLGQALELVAVLIGPAAAEPGAWRGAIAGGRREVRLHPAKRDGQLLIT